MWLGHESRGCAASRVRTRCLTHEHRFLSLKSVNDSPTIGTEIRRTRESMGLTLKAFAARANLPWQTLQGYESDRVVPPSNKLFKILHMSRRAPEPFRVERVARVLAAA